MDSKISIPVTPEIGLALETGLKDALKSLLGKEELRDQVEPNQTLRGISIKMQLDIESLSFGHDTDKAPTASIPILPTLALMVRRMGLQRDAALSLLREIMTEALTLDKKAADALLAEAGVEDAMEMIKAEVIAKLPRTKVCKTVKAKGAALQITSVTQAE